MRYSQIIYEESFPKISMEDYDLRIENVKKNFLHTNIQTHRPL